MTAVDVRGAIEVVGVPEDVATAIRAVYESTGGHDLPPAVLAAARSPESPLHRYFEWDDTAAAEAHRTAQAEQLVRRVRVQVIPTGSLEPVRVRAYVSRRELPSPEPEDTRPGSYLAIEDVAQATDMQVALLQAIERDYQRFRRKYSSVAEFGRIVADLLAEDD